MDTVLGSETIEAVPEQMETILGFVVTELGRHINNECYTLHQYIPSDFLGKFIDKLNESAQRMSKSSEYFCPLVSKSSVEEYRTKIWQIYYDFSYRFTYPERLDKVDEMVKKACFNIKRIWFFDGSNF